MKLKKKNQKSHQNVFIELLEIEKCVKDVKQFQHFQMKDFYKFKGIIDKDNVDQTAEQRYYGADDNQNCDPTRCGVPKGRLSFHNEQLLIMIYSLIQIIVTTIFFKQHKLQRHAI